MRKAKPDNAVQEPKYVTKIEYVSLIIARLGGVFGSTLTGALATTFLYELYFVGKGFDSDGIAQMSAVQTTITTILGLIMPVVAGVIVQKWKSHWGRYRQWYVICSIPIFVLTVTFYWVPKGWTVEQMCLFRYALMATQTFFNAFNNLGQNLMQVITPNYKEKKSIATIWQISYYLGYGLAYLSPEIFKIFVPKGSEHYSNRFLVLTLIASSITLVGNLMCGFLCRERIELPKHQKSKYNLISLFKYRNYRAYQYYTWVNVLANLGKFSSFLVAITVGSSNAILLTIPTAAGTVVGNLICGAVAKKYEPTKILRFCGVYSLAASVLLFGVCYLEKCMGLYFWQNWYAAFFYIFYFVFGIGVGLQELSNSHFTVEYYDYLEWQVGERIESVQGIIPGWINSGITYAKEMLIPFVIAWIAYPTNDEDSTIELIDIIQKRIAAGTLSEEQYLNTCLWLVALLVFTYALCNVFKALIIKFFYSIEGEEKQKMYQELAVIREKVHETNEEAERHTAAKADA